MEAQAIIIDAMHGVIPDVAGGRFTHRSLVDLECFVKHLKERERPYVSLERSIQGYGDSLTIDDSTATAANAARLARSYGHEVTLFLNGYNVVEATPYCFCRLNAALDSTNAEVLVYEGVEYNFRDNRAKRRFRRVVKRRLVRFSTERDRQDFVTEVGYLLGISEIIVPPHLCTIKADDVKDLIQRGVDVQNHGWTHARIGSLQPDDHLEDIRRGREWLHAIYGVEARYFAVPNGDGLPPWDTSPHYSAWFLLDKRWATGKVAPGIFGRRSLTL